MHRLAGPLVRRQGIRAIAKSCQRSSVSLSLPYLLPANEATRLTTTTRREARCKTEAKVSDARHNLSPTYFTSKQKSLAGLGGEPKSVVLRLRRALEHRDIPALRLVYAELRTEALHLQDPSYASSHTRARDLSELKLDDIRAAMDLIVVTPTPDISYSKRRKSEKVREDDGPMRNTAESVQDGKLVQQMFLDISEIFGFAQDKRDCRRSVLGCAMQIRSSRAVFEHLQQLRSTYEDYRVSNYVHEGLAILEKCSRESNGSQTAQQLWTLLKEVGVKVHKSVRDSFLYVLFKSGNASQAMDIAQNGTERTRLLPLKQQETSSLSKFLKGISRAGQGRWPLAVKMADEVLDRAARDWTLVSLASWHDLLTYVGIVKGPSAALRLIKTAQHDGLLQADEETFIKLLLTHEGQMQRIAQSGTEEDVMRLFARIEDSCDVEPPVAAYTIALRAMLGLEVPSLSYRTEEIGREGVDTAVYEEGGIEGSLDEVPSANRRGSVPKHTPGQVHEATLLFQRLRARGLRPPSAFVRPLLIAYTSTYIPQIDKAMELYEYRRSFEEPLQIGIYNILLFACAKARDLPAAQSIFQDMIADGVLLNHRALADIVVVLMEASHSYNSAFHIYTRVRDAAKDLGGITLSKGAIEQKGPVFDESGWLKIIDRYSKLQFEQGSLPPVDNLLAMFSDMRASGYAPDPQQYTSLLKLYGRTATQALNSIAKMDSKDKTGRSKVFSQVEEIRVAIRSIHHFLQSEETIEPDLVLITCLMDAYNRAGRSQHALEIWHRLILNKTLVDSACIAVVLDTCGHAGLIQEARRAWNWVQRQGDLQRQQCNKSVWSAYVECLARCGYLLEAIDVAFLEMRQALERSGDKSDAKTMEMLLRFASTEKHRWNRGSKEEYYLLDHLKRRIRAEMPDVWDQVKAIHIPLSL